MVASQAKWLFKRIYTRSPDKLVALDFSLWLGTHAETYVCLPLVSKIFF